MSGRRDPVTTIVVIQPGPLCRKADSEVVDLSAEISKLKTALGLAAVENLRRDLEQARWLGSERFTTASSRKQALG